MPASRVLPAPVGARPWLVLDGSRAWAYAWRERALSKARMVAKRRGHAFVVCLPLGEVIYVRG